MRRSNVMQSFATASFVVVFGMQLWAQGISAQPTTNIPRGMPSEMNRPVSISGEVVLEDGSPLMEAASITRVCGSASRGQQYTDASGKFTLLLDNEQSLGFQGASEGGGSSEMGAQTPGRSSYTSRTRLWGCEIRAHLPGYITGVASLAGRDFSQPVSIGRIVLRPINGTAARSVSAIDLKAPEKAQKEFQKGREEYFKKKYESADKHLAKAVDLYPQYVSALDLRGRAQRAIRQEDAAESSFNQAIAADEKFVPAYLHLAALQATKGKWPEVVRLSDKAIELEPVAYVEPYYFRAVGHLMQRQVPEAETDAAKVLDMDKEHRFPRAELMMGNIQRSKGNLQGAAEHYRLYITYDPKAPEREGIEKFLAENSSQKPAPQK